MALKEDLEAYVSSTFKTQWEKRDGRDVPDPTALKLSNDAMRFERATVLYADLTGSTGLVDGSLWQFAGEIYKTYLYCAAKLINDGGGTITSYDGDRVMGVFIGQYQTTTAAKVALKLNWVVQNVINPRLVAQYPSQAYRVQQVVGIDTSEIHAARTGVRGGNDLVWIGPAANHAAKMTSLKPGPTWISGKGFGFLADEAKYGGPEKKLMWEKRLWTARNNAEIYCSSWSWSL